MPVFKLPAGIKLAGPRLDEDGDGDLVAKWFEGFKDKYASVRDGWGTQADLASMAIHDPQGFRGLFYGMFPDSVREKMRFVGAGTTRICFISDRNVCYKFEFNDFNSQSLNEIRDALRWGHLSCFPRLFSHSADGCAMAYEVAEKPAQNDFVHLFGGADCDWVASQLSLYARSKPDRLGLLLGSGELNPPQEKILRDLMHFQRTTFDERGKCLEDINHVDNWGKIYREGWPVLIVTDFGL